MTSLTLKRYRSVISSKLTFDNPTFLIGRNGAGKSNIVDALNFLADSISNPLEVAFDKRGGIESVRNRSGSGPGYPPNLGLRVAFTGIARNSNNIDEVVEGDFAFEIKARQSGGFSLIRERCYIKYQSGALIYYDRRPGSRIESSLEYLKSDAWQGVPNGYLLLSWLNGVPGFTDVYALLIGIRSYSIDPSELRKPQDHDLGYLLRPNGSNAGSVLRVLERSNATLLPQICELLAQVTPNTTAIKTIKHGKQLTLEFQQQWGDNKKIRFEAYSASDGTLRALGILIALMQAPPASLLIIEEPESSLHPGALDALLQVIHSRANSIQILITTHSSDLLDAKWLKPENLRLVTWNGGSDVKLISPRAVRALKSHLNTAGDLLRANALDEPFPLQIFEQHHENVLFPEHK